MTLDKDALNQLNTFYSIISPSDLVSGYSLTTTNNKLFEQILKVLIDTNNQGTRFAKEIVQDLNNLLTKGDDNATQLKEHFNDLIQVYHNGEKLSEATYDSKLNAILGGFSQLSQVNLAIILSNTPRVSQCVRSVNQITTFMNAIPTIELSRCIPFLDIQYEIGRTPVSSDGRIQTISLTKFLIGSEKLSNASDPDKKMVQAMELEKDKSTKVGMDIFLSPQTLVNADFKQDTKLRNSPLIDSFRPFLSIDSFSVEGAPLVAGLQTYKTAKLSLTLHDRSRLAEISDLVKPEVYINTKLKISYGWSHPDGLDKNNVYANLINGMRITEKFGIVNASYTLDTVGQMKITLDLAMVGANEFKVLQIAESPEYINIQKQIQRLAESVSALRTKLGLRSVGGKEVRVYQLLDGTERGSLPTLEPDDIKELNKFIISLRKDKSKETQALADNLEALFGKPKQDGLQKELEKTVIGQISKKFAKIISGTDPFLEANFSGLKDQYNFKTTSASSKTLAAKFGDTVEKTLTVNKLVSLGKLFLIFVGQAFQSLEGIIDEVQFVYYTFNESAGLAGGANIAEFPVEVEYFKNIFNDYVKQKGNPNLPLGEFVNLINDALINDMRAPAYGFRNLYMPRTSLEKQPDPAKGVTDKQIADRQAKITDKAGGVFKQPALEYYIETLPNVTNPGKTIIRIHFYDKQTSPYSAAQQLIQADMGIQNIIKGQNLTQAASNAFQQQILLQAYSNIINNDLKGTGLGTLFNLKDGYIEAVGNTDDIKKFVSQIVPTIKYGTNTTNIMSANLQSMQMQELSTVNMLRAGKANLVQPNGSGVGSVPLRVIPSQLDVSSFGCPLLNINQQFFFDFNTGTSIDNIYLLTGLSHNISAGKFESRWKLVPLDAYGVYESITDKIEQLKNIAQTSTFG